MALYRYETSFTLVLTSSGSHCGTLEKCLTTFPNSRRSMKINEKNVVLLDTSRFPANFDETPKNVNLGQNCCFNRKLCGGLF